MNVTKIIASFLIIIVLIISLPFIVFKPYPTDWLKISVGDKQSQVEGELQLSFMPKNMTETGAKGIEFYFVLTNTSNTTYTKDISFHPFWVILYPQDGNEPIAVIKPFQAEPAMARYFELKSGESVEYHFDWSEKTYVYFIHGGFFLLLPGSYRISGGWTIEGNKADIETPQTTLTVTL